MNLPSFFQSKPDVSSLKYKKPIDEQLTTKLIYFIQSSCKKSSGIIVEVNGTANSLAAAILLNKSLGEKAIIMIFDFDTPKTQEIINICTLLGLNIYILKRGAAYQKELASYHLHKQEDIENFYKHFISYHLTIQAELMKASLMDIEDKSDRLTNQRPNGFYGQIMPFYSLYKTEICDLAKLLDISQSFPSYDYWKKVDPILFLLTEKQMKPEEISQQYNIDFHWLKKLKSHIDKQLLQTTVNQFII